MDAVLDVISWVLLVGGGAVAVISGVGLLRLPDLYTRMHAASMLDSLGAICVFLGLALQAETVAVAIKLLLAPAFLLLTTATAAHVLGKSARRAGLEPLEDTAASPQASGGKD